MRFSEIHKFDGDYFFSTMPVKDLLHAMDPPPPAAIGEIGDHLVYRDFLTVGLLCEGLKVRDDHAQAGTLIKDNWIYIQEPDVKLGRLQIFNNWSPYMVSDKSKVWVGLEYFCFEGDELWNMPDDELVQFGAQEPAKIDIIDQAQVLDGTVLRMDKTYPAYFRLVRPVPRNPKVCRWVRKPIPGWAHNRAVPRQQLRDERDTSNVLVAIIFAESEILAQVVTDYIAINYFYLQAVSSSSVATALQIVVLPAPLNPVNQTVRPFWRLTSDPA